jgi:hypothetical protein
MRAVPDGTFSEVGVEETHVFDALDRRKDRCHLWMLDEVLEQRRRPTPLRPDDQEVWKLALGTGDVPDRSE